MLAIFSAAVVLALVSGGNISGRVVLVDDSTPIPGVTVCIEGHGRCVLADVNGDFSFSQLPAQDRVTLTTEITGFLRSSYSTCVARRGTTEVVIPVSLPPVISTCTLWFDPVSKRYVDPASMRYGVSGVVLDPRDAAMSGVVLEIRDSKGVAHWKGRSARDGRFDVDGLVDGRFTLHLSKRGYLAQSVDFSVSYCTPQASLRPRLGPRCK